MGTWLTVFRQGLVLGLAVLLLAPTAQAQEDFDVLEASISELQAALSAGRISSVELVERYLARIEAYDRGGPELNSFIRVNPRASERARELDEERAADGVRGPLHGIPVVVKDNYNTADMPTTGGSVALAGFVPNGDASAVARLRGAGAIILGKTNLHEYAYGITTVGSLQGRTRNPYAPRRVPGGSSGGTAAAVAANLAPVGMGSDTCGSIRIPAAFNNLVGLRPTKGVTSIEGLMPLAHSQDVAGPLARSTGDLAAVLDLVAGHDLADPATSILADRPPPAFSEQLDSVDISELRLGRLGGLFESADAPVRDVLNQALARLEEQGATVVDVALPDHADELLEASGRIGHEFRSDLDAYLGRSGSRRVPSLQAIVDQGLHHEAVAGRLAAAASGTVDEQAHGEALAAGEQLKALVEDRLDAWNVDAMVYPGIASLPVFIGADQPGNNCRLSAHSGLPALNLPAGFSDSGLPVGMELLGRHLADARLLAVGHAIESVLDARRPPAATPALEDGQAPGPARYSLAFEEDGLRVSGELVHQRNSRDLTYRLEIESTDGIFHGAGLAIGEPSAQPDELALVANLAGPEAGSTVEGSVPLTPQLRRALDEERVVVRLFAASLPPVGATLQPELVDESMQP